MNLKRKIIKLGILEILVPLTLSASGENKIIEQLARYLSFTPHVQTSFNKCTTLSHALQELPQEQEPIVLRGGEKNLLFVAYPELCKKLSYVHFADLPTPIHACKNLSKQLGVDLFVKQDGLAGPCDEQGRRLFGGNKVRKLQYLLADALAKNCSSVITLGCVGSNHALQTVIYAQRLGLKPITVLKPQPNSSVVRQNLLLQKAFGAQMISTENSPMRELTVAATLAQKKREEGKFPYFIPLGGSCALGAVGFVQAAFELREQIARGLIPTPAHVYQTCSAGSGGTAVGLLIGFVLAGINTRLHLVLDEPEDFPGMAEQRIAQLFEETAELLHRLDPKIPLVTLSKDQYAIDSSCTGSEYGLATPECVAAMKLMLEQEHITLDLTYTGKCFAALCADARAKRISGTVLFWNTFCGEDMSSFIKGVDYHMLPKPLHQYFENN